MCVSFTFKDSLFPQRADSGFTISICVQSSHLSSFPEEFTGASQVKSQIFFNLILLNFIRKFWFFMLMLVHPRTCISFCVWAAAVFNLYFWISYKVESFPQVECEEKGRECGLILGIGFCGFFEIYGFAKVSHDLFVSPRKCSWCVSSDFFFWLIVFIKPIKERKSS